MSADIQQYINSGVLETYILGAATAEEEQQIKHLQTQYPEVKYALQQLETDFENMAKLMVITPPPIIWNKIEAEISDLIKHGQTMPQNFDQATRDSYTRQSNGQHYIEVEAENRRMNIHKNWKWIFFIVFILSKIFLICSIYFYLENRHSQQQIQELKQELKELRIRG